MGRDALFWRNPEEALCAAIVRDSNYFDLKDTSAKINSLEAVPKENTRTAKRLGKLGKREEDAGHYETACDYYYRACLFYGAAIWGIFDSDDEELIWLADNIGITFDKVIKYNRYPMERVEIPFEGKSISGILSLTPTRKKVPTILCVPGMDQHKESNLNHTNNFRDRLNGVPPEQNRRIVLVDWSKKENPIDEDRIAKGFSFFSADRL